MLLVVVVGCCWPSMVAVGCSWLLLVAVGCICLLKLVVVCRGLSLFVVCCLWLPGASRSELWTPKTLKQKSSKELLDNDTPTRTQHHEAKAPSPDKKDRRRAHRNHTQESLDSTHKCRVESPAKCARRVGHSNISSEICTACRPQQRFASPGSGVTRPNSPVREAARFCFSFY